MIDTDLFGPDRKVRIEETFEYIGRAENSELRKSPDGTLLRYDFDSYLFIVSDQKRIKRGISVEFEKIQTHYLDKLYGHVRNRLESGIITIADREYQYIITLIHPKSQNYITKYLFRFGGYEPPSCGLAIIVSRVYGSKRDKLAGMRYFEDIGDSGFPCPRWEKKNQLVPGQLEYLENFRKRFFSSFEFVSD